MRRRPPPRIIQNEEDANPRREPIHLLHNTVDGFAASETNSVNNGTSLTKKKAKATVTLSECLSCSGSCVTPAEAVLLSHHSIDKFRELRIGPTIYNREEANSLNDIPGCIG